MTQKTLPALTADLMNFATDWMSGEDFNISEEDRQAFHRRWNVLTPRTNWSQLVQHAQQAAIAGDVNNAGGTRICQIIKGKS